MNVLNWLRREEPKLYERTEYTIVEISERLAERQTERVCAVHDVRNGLKGWRIIGGGAMGFVSIFAFFWAALPGSKIP